MDKFDFRTALEEYLSGESEQEMDAGFGLENVDDDRECAEELLKLALDALNEIPDTRIDHLNLSTYAICSKIDKYFREQAEDEESI